MKRISIKVIIENSCIKENILAQHGLALLIEYNNKKYLFDCGHIIEWLLYNMKSMKININTIDGIIISHRDHDHCGSLKELTKKLKKQAIFVTPDFDIKKYTYKHFVQVDAPKEIAKNIFLIGPLSNNKKCQEQSIAINMGKKWLVLLVWCAHPWIEHIISSAQHITGNKKIMGIIGWLHLIEMKKQKLQKTIQYLTSLNIKFILPWHCTGNEATQEIKKHLGNIVKIGCTGWLWAWSIIQLAPKLNFDINR